MKIILQELIKKVELLDVTDKINALNEIKFELHKISPFKDEPVDCVQWVKQDNVYANDYNPNSVAPPEMELLYLSILEDGYTQPVVTMTDENNKREVIDGFHRHRVGREYIDINAKIMGYLPVVTIRDERVEKSDRIASTIRHNRARGKHQVQLMSDIVVDLKKRNWSDQKIGRELGMDPDEVLRLCQISGLTEMFSDKEFSQAWEAENEDIEEFEQIEDES